MEPVSFNEPNYAPQSPQRKTGILTRLVISLGLAKDEKSAQTVLLIVAVIIFGAAVTVAVTGGVVGSGQPASTPIEFE